MQLEKFPQVLQNPDNSEYETNINMPKPPITNVLKIALSHGSSMYSPVTRQYCK